MSKCILRFQQLSNFVGYNLLGYRYNLKFHFDIHRALGLHQAVCIIDIKLVIKSIFVNAYCKYKPGKLQIMYLDISGVTFLHVFHPNVRDANPLTTSEIFSI